MDEEKKKNMADIAGSKKTIWHTSIVHRVSEKDAIIDGGTKDAAKAMQARIVRLNDRGMFTVADGNEIIVVQIHEGVYGCACEKFSKSTSIHVLCKHLIHLKLLIEQKKIPQLWIDSPECEDMRKYLISTGWSIMDRMVYPHLDSPTADQPEVVKTLPPLNEDTSIDEATTLPPDEDSWKPDDEAKPAEEPKIITRRCSHCGYVAHGEDRDKVVKDIEEHRENCPDNPKNKKVPKTKEKPKVTKEPDAPKKTKVPKNQVTGKPTTDTDLVPRNEKREVVKKDMPTEAQFQTAAVARILKNQGSIYKVSGKDVPDSAAVSNYAISAGVSTETVVLEQTAEYARATVRAYKGGRYTEGSVLVRKDALLEKILIDLAEKNTDWITGWSNGLPVFDLDRVIFVGDKRKILGLHIAGTLADKWLFLSRDCETKAGRRAMIKMLGSDWRESTEVDSEVDEMKTVAKR